MKTGHLDMFVNVSESMFCICSGGVRHGSMRILAAPMCIALLVPSACAEVEFSQAEATAACLQRSWILQGYVEERAGNPPRLVATDKGREAYRGERPEEDKGGTPADFRFVSTGQFVIDHGEVKEPFPPYRLTCTGDFNRGIFSSVQIDGRLYRPGPGEMWPIRVIEDDEGESRPG